MRIQSSLLLALPFCLASPAVAQESLFNAGAVQVEGIEYEYRWMGPKAPVEGQSYPLVLFLHGAGERGSDNLAQLKHFPERMASEEYRERFPCFLIAPQCPNGTDWADGGRGLALGGRTSPAPRPAMQAALLAMDEVLAMPDLPVDRDRIYLTGLFMGGAGTWDLASRHPSWFAAATPICGGGDVTAASRLAGLPLSVWHGKDDTLVDPERSREMVAAVREAGGDVTYTELEGVGHGSWNKAYDLGNAIDWMFEQRRDPKAALAITMQQFTKGVAAGERIAFLGDSITQAGAQPGGYVDTLRVALTAKEQDCVAIPAGISGHKVPDLLKRYKKDVIEKKPTAVFIYIGINDVWHSDWDKGTSPEDFESGLRTLIHDFKAIGAVVVLATPSVIGEKRTGENKLDAMLAQFAAISRRVALDEDLVVCDLQRAFQKHLRVFNPANLNKGVLTSDGVHLNEAGNRFLAVETARALLQAFEKRGKGR